MSPISLAQLSQDNENHLFVAFKTPNYVPGFDHALVLLVEKDGRVDDWKMVEKEADFRGMIFTYLDFKNASYATGSNTSGNKDDVGMSRQSLIRINPGDTWTSVRQRFNPNQPDTDTDGMLEFYAIIAIVAVAGGKPVAMIGDIVKTPVLNVRTAS